MRERVTFWGALAEDQVRPMGVTLAPGPLLVPVAQDDLSDVVDVLVDNVFAHTPDGTPFEVRMEEEGGHVVLVVEDRGPGLRSRSGHVRTGSTGLGLDIVRRTAAAGGGELRSGPATPTGARVEVRLPRLQG